VSWKGNTKTDMDEPVRRLLGRGKSSSSLISEFLVLFWMTVSAVVMEAVVALVVVDIFGLFSTSNICDGDCDDGRGVVVATTPSQAYRQQLGVVGINLAVERGCCFG
jgi:hypothetical protein